MDSDVPADRRVKIVSVKESEKRYKYLELARELRKQWNMKVTVISVVTRALGTVPKDLERGM